MPQLNFKFSVLMFSLLWSCQLKEETQNTKQLSLAGHEIQVDLAVSGGSMVVYNDYLIKKTNYREDTVLQVIDIRDFSNNFNTIRKGKGPGEVANPAGLILDDNNGILWLTDWGKNCIHRFDIDSLLVNPDYRSSTSFPIDPSWVPTMNMFYHPSGNIGFTSVMLQKNLVSFMDLSGELVDSLVIPNKVYPDLWKDMGYSDNPLICKYIPEFDRMVIVSRHENKFSMVEMDGTPVWQKDDIPEASDKVFAGNFENSFYTFYADDTFIFLVYAGKQMGDFDAEGQFQVKYPNRLLVVDWEGNFRYDITLDHGIIYASLDKEHRRLICDAQDVDNYLVYYNLSSLYEE